MHNNVLMISYYFPPINTPGAFRSAKFAKYLPELGWNPFILTTKSTGRDDLDQDFLNDNISPIFIKKLPSKDLNFKGVSKVVASLPVFLSQGIFWKKQAIQSGLNIIRENDIDIIWSTAPPPICHYVGMKLKLRTGKPLVLDYRDPWTDNYYKKYPSKFHRFIDFYIEKNVLKSADYVVGVSGHIIDKITNTFSYNRNSIVIPNGYDPDDFKNIRKLPIINKITHLGDIYGKRVPVIINFFEELKYLEDKYPNLMSNIHFQFVGNIDNSIIEYAIKNFKKIKIDFVGKKNHGESLEIMCQSSTLLLVLEEINLNTLASKIFEYLASNRPILVLGVSDEIYRITENLENVINITNFTGIKLLNFLTDEMTKREMQWEVDYYSDRDNFLINYSRKKLTIELVKVLDSLV